MSKVDSNNNKLYYAAVDTSVYDQCIMVRMNGSNSTNNWNNKWDQSPDLTLANFDIFKVTGWTSAEL